MKYKDALAAIFIEGWIFIILSITGARQFLIKLLPRTLALSMSAGKPHLISSKLFKSVLLNLG